MFMKAVALLLLCSCSNEPELTEASDRQVPMQVSASVVTETKALVDGVTLPAGSRLGIKLVDNEGLSYDQQIYDNVPFATNDGLSWTAEGDQAILLSATLGQAYAYYPYVADMDMQAIPISSADDPADQVDYMYSAAPALVNNGQPMATFPMNHALSIVRFQIERGTYVGDGVVSSVTLQGQTASHTGWLNVLTGAVTATGAGHLFSYPKALRLGQSAYGQFCVVPAGTESALRFELVMDGQTYQVSTGSLTLQSGKVYNYSLTIDSPGITISPLYMTPWEDEIHWVEV